MILTTRVFCPPGTQYTRGGTISPGNICPWGLNILGKSVQGTSIPRIFCLGGQNWRGTENPPTMVLKVGVVTPPSGSTPVGLVLHGSGIN